MNDDIKYIQNTLWMMYKEFENDFDMKKYNDQAINLCRRYKEEPVMLNFCQNLTISWAPIINEMGRKHREEAA